MHILGPSENARECEERQPGCLGTTRRLYGTNNKPICVLCRMKMLREIAPQIREKPAQAIDAWEPPVLP